MNEKIKTFLTSEKTMRAVNLLFLLSMLIPGVGIIYLAYLLWIAYLVYFIRRTPVEGYKNMEQHINYPCFRHDPCESVFHAADFLSGGEEK